MVKPRYDENDFLTICALRFDGYKYREIRLAQDNVDIDRLSDEMTRTREFFDSPLDNLATFFLLQRYLGKWGGERLTVFSDEHILFRLLFLHLYREEIPAEFQLSEYYDRWRQKYEPVREELAAQIRCTFRRVGRGAKIQL